MNYKQCSMKHRDGFVHVAWIPTEFARRGKFLKLLFGSDWQNGWQVIEVYSEVKNKELLDLERNVHKDFVYVLGE